MAFEGHDAFDDPYSYKATNTLKNKLGLRDPALLESFELEMTTLRANEALPSGKLRRPALSAGPPPPLPGRLQLDFCAKVLVLRHAHDQQSVCKLWNC